MRVNARRGRPADTLAEELDAARRAAGIVLPKCEGPQDLLALAERMPPGQEIVAIVTETARGIQCLPDFREPLPRLAGLMWGAEDLCADLQ